MLTLRYQGWMECRLATDPDPTDEPRGVSGWTFAVAGERDLDRSIRFQPDGAVNRPHSVEVGVAVDQVSLDATALPGHPLLGAPVELLDGAVFEGRNGIAAEDAEEPILPYHLRVQKGGITLRREHRDPKTGERIADPPVGFARVPPAVATALGTTDPVAYRTARRDKLALALASSADPVEQVALKKRIHDIEHGDGIAVATLGFALRYRIVMTGPYVEVRDSGHHLGGTVDTSPWISTFWVGAWDADALCGYVMGTLDLPFRPD